MKTGKIRSNLLGQIRKIAFKHFMGFLGIAIIIGLFFTAAKCLSCSGQMLIDMRGFHLVQETSDGADRSLVAENINTIDLAEGYNLTESKEFSVDLARWDVAGSVWIPQIKGARAFEKDKSTIEFDLPANDTQYYIYTFPGSWSSPPQGGDTFFRNFGNGNDLRVEFNYTLQDDLDSFMLFFQQYDDKQSIDSKSWGIPNKKGNNNFIKEIEIRPEAKSFRIYLRFINMTPNEITLESLKLHEYTLVLSKIENNFKKLSFDLSLFGISRDQGLVVLKKDLDLKARNNYHKLYFFISVVTGELDKTQLSSLRIKAFIDKDMVWTRPISDIGNPTFVEQNIDFLNSNNLSGISFSVGSDYIDSPMPNTDQNIHIAIEYLDIR
jgi:hypothetical protein